MYSAELAYDAGAQLGEGPVWDATAGLLVWVDITGGVVHRTRLPDAGQRSVSDQAEVVGQDVGFVVPTDDGRYVIGAVDGLRLLDSAAGHPVVGDIPNPPGVRTNDGKVAPDGRVVFGSMAYDMRPGAAALYSFDGRDTVVLERDVTISNGLAWSADGQTMFYVDTPLGRVDAFDYDVTSGLVAERRTVARIPPEWGAPDGMAIDLDGALWVALWGGGAIARVEPGGVVERAIRVPTPNPTSCTFLGPGRMAITTASIDVEDPDDGAGGVFLPDVPGCAGQPVHRLRLPR